MRRQLMRGTTARVLGGGSGSRTWEAGSTVFAPAEPGDDAATVFVVATCAAGRPTGATRYADQTPASAPIVLPMGAAVTAFVRRRDPIPT